MLMREPTRLETTVSWIGWHLGELAGVIAPIVAAVWLTWWFASVSVLVGALWAVQEWRAHRKRRQLQRGRDQRHLASADTAGAGVVHVLPREGA